jgi:hypothetical protein
LAVIAREINHVMHQENYIYSLLIKSSKSSGVKGVNIVSSPSISGTEGNCIICRRSVRSSKEDATNHTSPETGVAGEQCISASFVVSIDVSVGAVTLEVAAEIN